MTKERTSGKTPAVKESVRKLLRESDISLGEYAYREVREAIRDGRFAPSRRLRESDISEMLGISRTPVREAMKRLESEQLVVFRPPRGFVVNSLGMEEIVELYAVRELLEGAAARFAAMQMSSLELFELEAVLKLQKAAIDDPGRMAELNMDFHRIIYRSARNRYLMSALSSLGDALQLLTVTTYASPGRGKSGYAEHMAIFEALNARDPDLAEKRAREHILNANAVRLQMLSTSYLAGKGQKARR